MTTKYLLQLLLKTFAYAFALSFVLGSAYYITTVNLGSYAHAAASIIVGALLLIMVLTLMAFSALFLTNPSLYRIKLIRLLLFFGGSIVFLIFVLLRQMSLSDTVFYSITGFSFFIVQCFLYFKMVKQHPAV